MLALLKRKPKRRIVLLIMIILVLISGGYLLFNANDNPTLTAPLVVVGPVTSQNVPLTILTLGNLVAPESTMLKSQQSGLVTQVYFKNGQAVKQGDLLLQLDASAQQATYNKDKAALYQAQTLYQRYTELNQVDPSVLAQAQIDQVYAKYQEAKATLQGDAEALAQMQIRAPFNGVLGATNISVGTFLNAGSEVVAIVNPNNLQVSYPVPEDDFALVALGQKVSLSSDAYPGTVFSGTVVYKGPLVDPNSRSFTVRAQVDNPTGLAEGMLIHITHVLTPNRMVLAVPTSALVSEMSGFGVYQVKNNKVVETYVQTGSQFGNYTEITSGLNPGDEIILQGNEKVEPGMSVKVSGS